MTNTTMILVTGATGTNGRALVPLLTAAGARVRAPCAALADIDRAFLLTNSTERAEAHAR